MFRLNYTYDNNNLLTLTARADGSPSFGKNTNGQCSSGAVSWKVPDERKRFTVKKT